MANSFYREIINDHNLRPSHKRPLPDADLELRGVNPSCGDDIILKLKVLLESLIVSILFQTKKKLIY